jgi:hypothetical protein
VTHELNEKARVSALAEVYFRDDMSDDYVYDEYLTYARTLGHGFGFLCQAYFESVQAPDGQWSGVRSAVAGPTYQTEIPWGVRLKLEDRFFFRLNSPADWDYHRPRIYLSRGIGPLTLTVSDEMRMDLSGERDEAFYRNRLFATVLWKATETLTLGLGYFRQWDREDDGGWSAFNGVQTVMMIAL